MGITLSAVHETTASLPPRLLLHGLPGVGKTTLGTRFPKPVFLQTEDGTPAGSRLDTFGLLSSYADVRDALAALGNEEHDFQTVVLDGLDKLEGLVWADVCETNKWPSIEAPGYGKGYVIADKWWRDLLAGLNWLRRERDLTIVLLAHSAVETVSDPRAPAYTSYQLRLHKRARGLVQDEMDGIFFLATEVHVVTEDLGFNKKRSRADGGAARWLHCEGHPAFVAKSRFELPPKMLCPKDFDVGKSLAPIFPRVAPGEQIRSATNNQTDRSQYE